MGKVERQVILDIAQRQYGVVSRRQIEELFPATDQIRALLNSGWLIPAFHGVCSVGRPIECFEGWLMAGVLKAGPGSFVARSCAAAHWGIGKRPGVIEIVRPHGRSSNCSFVARQGSGRRLVIHRSRSLPESEVTTHRRVPVTTVARTLLDMAPLVSGGELCDVFDEAARRSRIDIDALEQMLDRGPGRHGSAALRELTEEWHPDDARARSRLENRFMRLVTRAGFPRPEQNVKVLGYEVDCLWRSRRVVVELDSVSFHAQPSVLDSDRERDIELRMNGYEILRFTHRRVKAKPGWVIAKLGQVLSGCD